MSADHSQTTGPIDVMAIAFAQYHRAERQWAQIQMMPGDFVASWPATDGGAALLLRAMIAMRDAVEDVEAVRILFKAWWEELHAPRRARLWRRVKALMS